MKAVYIIANIAVQLKMFKLKNILLRIISAYVLSSYLSIIMEMTNSKVGFDPELNSIQMCVSWKLKMIIKLFDNTFNFDTSDFDIVTFRSMSIYLLRYELQNTFFIIWVTAFVLGVKISTVFKKNQLLLANDVAWIFFFNTTRIF